MSNAPFERYDAEFLSLSEQVKSKISQLVSKSADSEIKYCQGLLSQCDDLLKQMQVEARSVDDTTAKRELLQKVRVCKAQLANLRDDFSTAQANAEREALLGGNADLETGKSGGTSDHRERLLKTNDQISKQNETLDRAQRVMAETEDVALEITSELGRNREKISSSHQRVRDVSGLTNQARRIVQSMSRREVQQKLMMYLVAALLVIAVIVILYAMGK